MSTAVPPPDRADRAASSPERTVAADHDTSHDTRSVVARQKERFGGLQFGATFFGWLAAAGAGVLMTALLASLGAGIGLSARLNPDEVTGNAGTMGIVSARWRCWW